MARDFDDDELRAVRAAFERDDTPTAPHWLRGRQPRGCVRDGGVVVVETDAAGGSRDGNAATPDPPDLRLRRVLPNT